MTKKKSKEERDEKYGLSSYHAPNAKDFIDFDYVDKLTKEVRAWLAKFSSEYYQGGPRKADKKSLHRTAELRKDTYATNNSRHRDMWNRFDRAPLDYTGTQPDEEVDE